MLGGEGGERVLDSVGCNFFVLSQNFINSGRVWSWGGAVSKLGYRLEIGERKQVCALSLHIIGCAYLIGEGELVLSVGFMSSHLWVQ